MILIYSIDFDGCLDSACQSAKYKAFLENLSQEAQKSLQENAKNPPTVEILIGSQRQSPAEEIRMITGHSHPCAGYYKRFKEDLQITLRKRKKTKAIEVIFNPFLLGDLFYNFSHGTSFTQLEQLQKDYIGNPSTIEGTEHFIDHSKLLLIYAQIHYIANKYKTEEIRYGFYDDKEKEILSNLDNFFKKNPCWIPSNIELFLYRYAKNDLKPEPISKIKGVGEINNNYSRTIKDLLVYNGICSRLIYSNKYKKEYHISPKKVLPALSALKDSSHSTALKLLQNTHRGILNKRVLFEVENTSRQIENQNYILSNLYQVYSPHFELTPKHVKILTLNKFAISRDLFIKFTEYAKNIEISDVNMRISLQSSLCGKDSEYFMGQGSVYSKQIMSNRRAIRQLFNNHHGASILITPERGGGLVLDLLKSLRFKSILSKRDSGKISLIKIPKFSEETTDKFEMDEAVYEIKKNPWSSLFTNDGATLTKPLMPEYSRKEHIQRLEEAIILAIKNGHKTIGLVDTMVSGISACILIKIAQKIGSLYRNIKFNILIHQHTLEIDKPYAHPNAYSLYSSKKTIKLSAKNDFHIEKIIPQKAIIVNEKEKSKTLCFGKITFANGNEKNEHNYNSIIGEDVGFQLSYEGPNTSKPFCIFDHNINVVVLKPSGGTTAREAVLMLINGELDNGLKECGILLEDDPNLTQFKGEPSKNFKKLALENNTFNTQMWKKSAEIASSEIKMSKKQKSSLKRGYDKQGQEQMNSIISDKKPYYQI